MQVTFSFNQDKTEDYPGRDISMVYEFDEDDHAVTHMELTQCFVDFLRALSFHIKPAGEYNLNGD